MKLFYNPTKDWAVKLADKLRSLPLPRDLSVVIGGDGTLFYYKDQLEGKVLLIGSEHSYRNHLVYTHLQELNNVLSRESHPLTTLEVGNKFAINDIVVHSADYRVMDVKLELGDGSIYEFRGDGLIISTGFGSTAYNYSAGGPRLDPFDDRLVITPIAPYLRKMGPIVYSGDYLKVSFDGVWMLDGVLQDRRSQSLEIRKGFTDWKYFEF